MDQNRHNNDVDSVTTTPQRPTTSSSTTASARKTRASAAAAARALLASQKILDDDQHDLNSMAQALNKIAAQLAKNKTSAKHGEAVRAVATLLEEVVVDGLAERVAERMARAVDVKLSARYQRWDHTVDALNQATLANDAKLEEMKRMLEAFSGQADSVCKTLTESSTALATTRLDYPDSNDADTARVGGPHRGTIPATG